MAEQRAGADPHRILGRLGRVWPNPVVIKEMRGQMRRRRTYLVLTAYLVFLAGVSCLVYFLMAASSESDPDLYRSIGRAIFLTGLLIQLAAIVFITPAFTGSSISGERERQTYELLRTTLVSAREVVDGKYLSGFLLVVLLLLTSLPLQAIAFLFGGIEMQEFFASSLMLVITAGVLCAIGVYFSSLLKRTLPATVLAYTVANLFVLGLPILLILLAYFLLPILNLNLFGTLDQAFRGPGLLGQVLMAAVVWILATSNPVSAAAVSDMLWVDEGVIFWFEWELSKGVTFHFLSPWLGFILIYSLVTWIFYRLAIRQVSKKDTS